MSNSSLARTYDEFDEAVESGYKQPKIISKIYAPPVLEVLDTNSIDVNSIDIDSNLFRIRELLPVPTIADDFPRSFQLIQKWEGKVIAVMEDSFVAEVADKTTLSNDEEEMEIDIREVPSDDLHLLRPGSFFYWAIGYEDGRGVPRQRVSRIRFQRLPGLTIRDIDRAKDAAMEFSALFK